MSFARYLHENRTQLIDHRATAHPLSRGKPLEPEPEPAADVGTRRGRASTARLALRVRFRQVRPVFAPSPYTEPLPYLEPWRRQ